MAIEPKRGCGYRKAGGLYLVSDKAHTIKCHKLPLLLTVCPVCNAGVKFSRGWTWIEPLELIGKCKRVGKVDGVWEFCHHRKCPICIPPKGKHGLLWVGNKYYTPDKFKKEVVTLGMSKRISSVPKNLKLGETIVYFAHMKAGSRPLQDVDIKNDLIDTELCPAIFYVCRPSRIEKILKESDATIKELDKLSKRNITPVIVPDDDKDHQ